MSSRHHRTKVPARLLLVAATAAAMTASGFAHAQESTEPGDPGGGPSVFTGLARAAEANLFVGAATTTIPIDVPPGRKAVTPRLALRYSSGGGPSPYGHGWDLPIGRVRRNPKWGVPSCADPVQRRDFLVELPGASIECRLDDTATARVACRPRVEESYLRIFLTPTANRWDAWDRDGNHYVFGASPEARSGSVRDQPWLAADPCRQTSTWALEQIVDSNGNHIDIAYEHLDGVLYPVHLRYGGSRETRLPHAFEVRFLWQERVVIDRPTSSSDGHPATLARLLDRIEVSHPVGAAPVRTYDLAYDVDLEDRLRPARTGFLHAVTLLGRNGTALVRHDGLPAATVLAYAAPGAEHHGFVAGATVAPEMPKRRVLHESRTDGGQSHVVVGIRDMNGDGFPDLVDARNCHASENPFWEVYPGSVDGFAATPVAWRSPDTWHRCSLSFADVDQRDSVTRFDTMDLDGDAVPDFIDARTQPWRVFRGWRDATGAGGFAAPVAWPAWVTLGDSGRTALGAVRVSDDRKEWVDLVDWNADGLPDHVNAREERVRLNTGDGFEPTGFAVNFPERRLRYSRNDRLTEALYDMNGDGLPDHVRDADDGVWEVRLHNGRTLAAEADLWEVPRTCASGIRDRSDRDETRRDLVDLNGDGLPDLVDTCRWTAADPFWDVYLNQGSRFRAEAVRWRSPGARLRVETRGSTSRSFREVFDADGDGRADYVDVADSGTGPIQLYRNDTGYWTAGCEGTCRSARADAAATDALIAIENGVGARTSLAYAPSTYWDNRDSEGIVALPSLLWTLTRITQDSGTSGIGGNPRRQLLIRYAHGAFEPGTREFRGFGTVQTTEADGTRETTVFAQGAADRGRVRSTTLHPPGADPNDDPPLRATTNEWQCHSLASDDVVDCELFPSGAERIGIRLVATHVYDYGPDGSRRHAWREQRAWDAYGNALHVRVGGDDSRRIDTYSEFARADDLDEGGSHYLVSRPARVEVFSGRTIDESWFFYDGLELGRIGRGNLTRTEAWLNTSIVAAPPCTADGRRKCAITNLEHDAYGNPTGTVDALGRVTTVTYDSTHLHPVRETNAAGHVVETAYDLACGKLVRRTGADSATRTETVYDDFCRPRMTMLPEQDATTAERRWEYFLGAPGVPTDIVLHRAEPASPTGRVSTHELHDGLGRRVQRQSDAVVDGARVVVASDSTVYDERGRPVITYAPVVVDPLLVRGAATYRGAAANGPTRLFYDALGRVTRTLQTDGTERQASFPTPWQTESTGECFHAPDCEGARTVKAFDAHGNVSEKRIYDERGAPLAMTRYEYDARGRQISSQQWDGSRWLGSTRIRTTWDSLGRRIGIDDPDSGRWRFGYDLVGNLVYQDDPEAGQHIELCYDELNRLTQKHVVEGSDAYGGSTRCANPATATELYTWDDDAVPHGIGRLARVEDPSGITRIHAYDARGNALVVEKGIRVGANLEFATTAYAYDRAGHLTRVVYPDGERLHYEYDEAGNVRRAFSGNDGEIFLADLTYDHLGRPRQITHGNGAGGVGVIDTREYHDRSGLFRLARITVSANGGGRAGSCARGSRLVDAEIDRYTANGRIARIRHDSRCADLADTATYRYDGLGRLLEVTGKAAERFAYDPLGNLVNKDGRALAFTAGRPHTPVAFGVAALTHDRNGNRTADGAVTYTYDAEGRLVDVGDGALRIAYDHAGQRVRQTAGTITHRYFNELAEFRIEGGHPILTKHYFAGDLRVASRETIWRPRVRDAGSFVAAAGLLPSAAEVQTWIAAVLGFGLVALLLFPGRPRHRGGARCSTAVVALIAFLAAILPGPLTWAGPSRTFAAGGPGSQTVPLPTVIADPIDLRFHHYHADERGTPLLTTDGSGSVVEHIRYRAFGEVRGRWNADGAPAKTAAGFGFAGYANAAGTGLQYAGSRWYDPALGSFLSHDPARQFPNPYLYGGGDPLNGIDHAGAIFGLDDLFIAMIIGAIAGAVGGGVQAAINGASVGQALKAAAIGSAIGGASAGIGAGIIGPALADSVVPALASQLVRAGVAAPTATAVAGVAVYGTAIGSSLAQAGHQASRGNWGPLIGLGVAIGLNAAIAPPTPAEPASGLRTVATSGSDTLPNMAPADLQPGDVLITHDGTVASMTGHSAVVLEAEGNVVRVLSSDNRGQYVETNLDPAVGGRQWEVFRIDGIDRAGVVRFANAIDRGGGMQQYLGNRGANICSSTCAAAIEHAGGPVAPRLVLQIVTPAALRETYGPPIGRVFIPKLGSI